MIGTIAKIFLVSVVFLEMMTMVYSKCNNPGQIMNGRWNKSCRRDKLEIGAKWKLTCNKGFNLIGSPTMTCQSNGQWSSDVPSCTWGGYGPPNGYHVTRLPFKGRQNIRCPNLTLPAFSNGTLFFNQQLLEIGAKLVLSCYDGFTLQGNAEIICQPNGKWSGDLPRCVPETTPQHATTSISLVQVFCEDPGRPSGSHRVSTFTKNELESGAKMVFTCNEGFKMEGIDTTVCLPTGQWSSPVPKCLEDLPNESTTTISLSVFCKDPGVPLGSRRISYFNKSKLETGAKMVFTCNEGFQMVGRNTTRCLSTGRWSSSVPKCLEEESTTSVSLLSAFCEDPGLPQGARRVAYFERNELENGAMMVFTCNEGFKMEGSDTTICLPTKQWSSPVPKCLRDDVDEHGSAYPTLATACEDPGTPPNSIRTPSVSNFQLGSRVNYSCNKGFDIQGTQSLVCMYAGKWSSTPSECISNTNKDSCKEPLPPKNGKLSIIVSRTELNDPIILTVGSKVQYSCVAPYHLEGPDTRRCLNQGKWSGTEPKCVLDCGTFKSSQQTFIINSEVSQLGQWPWQAGISLEGKSLAKMYNGPKNIAFNTPDGSRGIICGGSLISNEWVLTAARCVTLEQTTVKYPIEDIGVYIGKQFRDPAKDDAFVQWSRVTDISVHKDFNRRQLTADIAVIRMQKLAVFSYRVLPICLPNMNLNSRSAMDNGTRGMVSGWGVTKGNGPSEQLNHGEIRLVPASECEKLDPGQSPTKINRVQKDQFCAKPISIDSGYSYLGDSGDPLMFEEDFGSRKRWVIEGVVSSAKEGYAISSSVYTRVKYYMNWMRLFVDDN